MGCITEENQNYIQMTIPMSHILNINTMEVIIYFYVKKDADLILKVKSISAYFLRIYKQHS